MRTTPQVTASRHVWTVIRNTDKLASLSKKYAALGGRLLHTSDGATGIWLTDIKPANIMVEWMPGGHPRPIVMDFGLARESNENRGLTETGAVLGTPAYMPPEQARGSSRRLDRRADVYSLGATLYELLTGQPPFTGREVVDVILAVLSDDPKPLRVARPSTPADLETIVLKCLAKEPAQRYDSARALAEDLQRYIDGEPIQGKRTSLLWRLRRRVRRNKGMFALGVAATLLTLVLGGLGLRSELLSRRQAALAQLLGQEIKDMEWLLRSAQQMPLHNLDREKAIVRENMKKLQAELASYGRSSRGLAHYALGRGHMALHEYPPALTHLRQAIAFGIDTAEVHYALGIVLGKHFEQAMYEARVSGGGDWAQKQLKQIEPQYLTPAISALVRSRSMKLAAPQYLEALLAYYQRDYDKALRQSDAALRAAPWLYEASKLAGDVHLERALRARDSGQYEESEREFKGAVENYEAAAAVGQSDGEVYEGLAEAWVRQIEMAVHRGQSAEAAYVVAVAVSDKLTIVDPQSIAGPLKKATATAMSMATLGTGMSSTERVRQCLAVVETALERQPEHPYANDVAAGCNLFAAEAVKAQGGNPEPFLRKAQRLLEPIVKNHPRFLWGLNDLGNIYLSLGIYSQLRGSPSAKELVQKAIESYAAAVSLDPTFSTGGSNILSALGWLVPEARSGEEMRSVLSRAEEWLVKCKSLNSRNPNCFNNYFQSYARVAHRDLLAGLDPQPWLNRAFEGLAMTRKLAGPLLDVEQHAALVHLVEANDRVRRRLDPTSAIAELQSDLTRCFSLASQDAMCRTLAARAEWVRADWLASQKKSVTASMDAALAKALQATQSLETYPDAWQTLAECHRRMAHAEQYKSKIRGQHIADGLAALEKVFAINPNHSLGLATQGALQVLQAEAAQDPAVQQSTARSAVQTLERALENDAFLHHAYAPLLEAARALASTPK